MNKTHLNKTSLAMATHNNTWLTRIVGLALAVGLALSASPASAGHVVAYVLTDHLGSPVIEMDISGQVLKREVYGPYGQAQISPNNSGIGYTGHMQDGDTGLTYMQARYFDPEAIRFLSTDPVRFSPGQPNHFNPYWYAEGNPYKYTDPDGRNITTAFGGVLYESAQFVQGNGFDGQSVIGALADGYNGQGAGFAASLGEDVLNFVPAGAAVKVVRVVGNLIKEAKVVNTVTKTAADVEKVAAPGKRTFSTADRAAGLEKAKDASGTPRCQYCGTELSSKSGRPNSYEADHTVPYSRGGPSTPENLTPSCRTCNRSKGAKTPEEWRRQ